VALLKNSAHRYLLVGLANTALDLLLFTLMAVALGVPPVLANVVSTVVVMTVSFFVNRAWVFRSESAGVKAYVGFVSVTLFSGLVLQSLVILGVIAAAHGVVPDLPDEVVKPGAKVVAMAVGMVSNFLGYRWVFGSAGSGEGRGDRSIDSSSSTIANP
jgi:putative flippase GtrA